jgi:hypothetical protein
MTQNEPEPGQVLSEDRPAEIAAWCARARTETDDMERAKIWCQLLLIGLRLKKLGTHPALLHQVHDAWQFMRQQNIASGER